MHESEGHISGTSQDPMHRYTQFLLHLLSVFYRNTLHSLYSMSAVIEFIYFTLIASLSLIALFLSLSMSDHHYNGIFTIEWKAWRSVSQWSTCSMGKCCSAAKRLYWSVRRRWQQQEEESVERSGHALQGWRCESSGSDQSITLLAHNSLQIDPLFDFWFTFTALLFVINNS